MVGKTALNKEMKHLNGAYFRTNNNTLFNHIKKIVVKQEVDSNTNISAELLIIQLSQPNSGSILKTKKTKIRIFKYSIN
ncbi:hypothetical protein D7Y07_16425 [Bacteroides acidifaciens]|uniref:Uncharacterized protein n=1 Tax=Bacteroides acidifaciens TaxID=85831 RepID=A0A3L7Z279_9BACE|nr:hypothetical protein D7Y07_16425 [Bacteroides acidifaciens]